jgi:hypothetical protein
MELLSPSAASKKRMSPQAQREAIAKACGWSCVDHSANGGPIWWVKNGRAVQHKRLPDYLNDLNAIHQACMEHLPADKRMTYFWELIDLLGYETNLAMSDTSALAIHATAAQRAEAFLKTMKLWIE